MHVETQRGDESRRVLVDYGFTPDALVNNTGHARDRPGQLDALVLSHGHYDHFGGLAGFLRQAKGQLRPKLPFYIGGEECFCSREWTGPPVKGNFGAIDRAALAEADVTVTFAEGPAMVGDHAFTTGQIPLTSFEKVLSPSQMTVGVEHGFGCYPERMSEEQRKLQVIPDQFQHEIATVLNLKGRGLIVLTSCSHRGVVNIVRQAQAVSGDPEGACRARRLPPRSYKEDYVREVVASLKEIDPDYIVPMHCTGEPFYEMVKAEMPEKLLRSFTGTRFVFEAEGHT